jgi:hypothetical protein
VAIVSPQKLLFPNDRENRRSSIFASQIQITTQSGFIEAVWFCQANESMGILSIEAISPELSQAADLFPVHRNNCQCQDGFASNRTPLSYLIFRFSHWMAA